MDLAQPAGVLAVDHDRGGAARMQERLRARRATRPGDAERVEQRSERRPWRRRSRPPAAAGRARSAGRTDPISSAADVVGLARRGRVAGRAGTRHPPRTAAASRRRAARLSLRDVEQRSRAASCAAATARPTSGSRARATSSLGSRSRRQLGADEAPADDLVQSLGGQRVGGAAAQPLAVGQPAGRAVAARQRRRQLLQPVEARDLLDQVGLAGDVGAPERGRP